jgi:hypothetical protein
MKHRAPKRHGVMITCIICATLITLSLINMIKEMSIQ